MAMIRRRRPSTIGLVSFLCLFFSLVHSLSSSTTNSLPSQTKSSSSNSNTMSSPSPLENKIICLTGASSGIGAAIAHGLYAQGAKLVIGARRVEKLAEVAKSCETSAATNCPGKVLAVACDVTNRESVQAFVKAACTHYQVDAPDSIVCCAGVMYFTQMKNCLMDQWDQTIDVNCRGVTNCMGAVLKGMTDAGRGKVIVISSDAGVRPFGSLAVYSASKHFVESLCEATRRELVGTGVTIHTIQPGDVKGTELILKNTDQEAAKGLGVEIGKPVGEGFSRNQLLDPQDIANAVVTVLTAPPHVSINTILIEPRDQE
jgi:NADP-dependent 3-hydroxy acid dehydrogenase YdfG